MKPQRSGATLIECLMAMLVMGIGVTSLATLFPISVLKSVQAHHLTGATILRQNAESFLKIIPSQSGRPHGLIVDPDNNGTDWDHPNGPGEPFVIDPLGWFSATAEGDRPPASYGHNGTGTALGNLTRYRAQATTQSAADYYCYSPDTWKERWSGIPVSSTLTSIDIDPSRPLVGMTFPDSLSRLLLIDDTNKSSQIRSVTSQSGNTLNWSGSEQLTTAFIVDRAVMQTQEARYSWLLTVRQRAFPNSDLDLVVFQRRAFGPNDEKVRSTETSQGFRLGSTTVVLEWALGDKPKFKKGGWILDPDNGYWYQIVNTASETPTTISITIGMPAWSASEHYMLPEGIVTVYPLGTYYDPLL